MKPNNNTVLKFSGKNEHDQQTAILTVFVRNVWPTQIMHNRGCSVPQFMQSKGQGLAESAEV